MDKTFDDIKLFELNQKDKMEFIIEDVISIIIVFNLDNRESFENIGKILMDLKKLYKFNGKIYLIGSSETGFKKTTDEEEVMSFINQSKIFAEYTEIIKYDKKTTMDFFKKIINFSAETAKIKKIPDNSNSPNMSCFLI